MKNLWIALIFAPTILLAQAKEGVRFEEGLTWQQAVAKARQQNKYIFVDAYATWCGPCKKMEKEVFPLRNVGDFMNARFLSVRVQMDTTKNDAQPVKAWYKDARALKDQYHVTVFPTFLFFSPDGNIVHQHVGAVPDSLFLKVAANALNPEKQYYTLLKEYQAGKKVYHRLNYLAETAQVTGDAALANQLARDYIQYHLNVKTKNALPEKKDLQFLNRFSNELKSDDEIFQSIYNNEKKVDELIGVEHYTTSLIASIIMREELSPAVEVANKNKMQPDWKALQTKVLQKFNAYYGNLALLYEQTNWSIKKKDNRGLVKYQVKIIDDYGLGITSWTMVNNVCYNTIFKYSNDIDTLNKAIHWMETINKDHPDDQINMDTYANLLHKVGRTNEAIALQEKAWQLETAAAKKENRPPDTSMKDALDKMKKGEPTWKKG